LGKKQREVGRAENHEREPQPAIGEGERRQCQCRCPHQPECHRQREVHRCGTLLVLRLHGSMNVGGVEAKAWQQRRERDDARRHGIDAERLDG
jgi:hypothetical protein